MSSTRTGPLFCALALVVLVTACADDPAAVGEDHGDSPQIAADVRPEGQSVARDGAFPRSHRAWLRNLRRTTAPYRRFRVAEAAGYDTQLTPCQVSEKGGMGFHYGNAALIDGTVEEQRPEVLLYEPTRSGELRLVAVEYIVPFSAWTKDAPPSLNGIEFHQNQTFGLWVLHAWVWKRNPTGVFQDWNPRVSCRFANRTR